MSADDLSTPPADDVREALAEQAWSLYQVEHGYSTWGTVPDVGADFMAGFERGYEVRPRGTVTPTVDEWSEQMDAERARQVEHGYDDAHDAEQGPAHLLNWAIDYGRRGKHIAAATLTRNALWLLAGRPAAASGEGPDLVSVIEGCVPDEVAGWRFRYSERIAAAVRAAFEVRPRGTVTPPADDVREALADEPVCAWCPNTARGSAWHNDGRLHPSCGQIGHGQGWVPPDHEVRPHGTVTDAELDADRAWDAYRFENWINEQREPNTEGVFRAGYEAAREARS